MDNSPIYTTIFHATRIDLGLTCNEYCIADTIYHLSNNPTSKRIGWCYASKQTLANTLGVSKQTVHKIIQKLLEKNLLEKSEKTKWVRTTTLWYNKTIGVKKVYPDGKESLPQTVKKVYPDGKESLHNNHKYNHINKNKDKKDFFSFKKEGEEKLKRTAGRYTKEDYDYKIEQYELKEENKINREWLNKFSTNIGKYN